MTTMTANNTDLAEDAVPANGAAPASRVEELQFLVQTGRLRHWQRGVTETLARAGLGGGLTAEEWAVTPWYGPLETWLKDGSTVSDILINGPGRDITIVEQGQRMASGITLHPEWVSFVQRQLILRSGLVTPEQVVDVQAMMWPAHALIGTADQRLRFAITRPPASPAGPTVSLRILPRRWRARCVDPARRRHRQRQDDPHCRTAAGNRRGEARGHDRGGPRAAGSAR